MSKKILKKTGNAFQRLGNFILTNRDVITMVLMVAVCAVCMLDPAFADTKSSSNYKSTVSGVFEKIVDIVGYVFQVVGAVLTVYSVGQLVMAFKNEDADSKTRASTQLVIGVILIAMPAIISSLDLKDKLK